MYRAGTKAQARKHDADVDRLQSNANVFMVKTTPVRDPKWGWISDVTSVALLVEPLRYQQLRSDRVLGKAAFVRRQMFGRSNATAYWYRLYDLIVRQNPGVRKALRPFAPESF
jgi:hypothetical protein